MGKATRFTSRKEIRKALASIISDNIPSLEGRVYPNRTTLHDSDDLPIVNIYPTDENYTVLNKAPTRILGRDATISIEIIAADSSEEIMSDILDDLAENIEEVIEDSDNLGELVHDINIDTATGNVSGEGDKPEASWIMNYNVTYIKTPKE